MKKALAVTLTAVLVGGLFSYAAAHQSQGKGWGRGNGPGSCLEDGKGSCFDSGAREQGDSRGRGFGPGNCRNGSRDSFGQVDDAEAATALVESLLERRNNPNLQVGKVTEAGRDFEVEIVTKDGSLANKLFVEKRSGRIIPAYR
jgi:hypothetical protein